MTSWTFFHRDLETRPFGHTAASGHFQHSDVQIGLRAVRQFDEAKTLAGVEPQYLGVDRVCGHGRGPLKVAWLESPFRKGNRVIVIPTPTWLALVSILAHDRLD
jgi:hypothetical protein